MGFNGVSFVLSASGALRYVNDGINLDVLTKNLRTLTRFIHIVCLAFLTSSCTSYQYVRLHSDLPKTADTGHYYAEDSVIYADFDFNGEYFPVKIFILNESDTAINLNLSQTVFVENGAVLADADQYFQEDSDGFLPIPAGKSVGLELRPFQSTYRKDIERQAAWIELESGDIKRMVSGIGLGSEGRELEIHLVYQVSDWDTRTLKAAFREDYIYFSRYSPDNFPGGLDPVQYHISQHSEEARMAAGILLDMAATISLYYLAVP